MRTLLPDPPPADFEALLERRRRLGLDRRDEVWDGVLHMNPTPSGAHMDVQQQLAELLGPPAWAAGLFPRLGGVNVGDSENFRVPHGVLQRERSSAVWHPTAALAVEILSPGDESWEKVGFYADHHVDELLFVDPLERTVQWFGLVGGQYRQIERSRLVDLGPTELASRIDWPPVEAP